MADTQRILYPPETKTAEQQRDHTSCEESTCWVFFVCCGSQTQLSTHKLWQQMPMPVAQSAPSSLWTCFHVWIFCTQSWLEGEKKGHPFIKYISIVHVQSQNENVQYYKNVYTGSGRGRRGGGVMIQHSHSFLYKNPILIHYFLFINVCHLVPSLLCLILSNPASQEQWKSKFHNIF